jgi:hypothetical protein
MEQPATEEPRWGSRQEAAIIAVRAVLARAEENYLANPDLGLAVWLARVEETLAVAARVTLARIEDHRLLIEEDVALGQCGVFADVAAEALRAASRLWGDRPGVEGTEDLLELVATGDHRSARPGWDELLEVLARCQAALEPIGNALREGDAPMEAARDHDGALSDAFIDVARLAFGVVYPLCG